MREADANFRFAPVFELTGTAVQRAVRIGPHVMSYHTLAPYPGWDAFKPEMDAAIDQLYAKAPDITVTRISLRYLNALTAEHHGIASPADLDVEVRVSEDRVSEKINLNFHSAIARDLQSAVRIATPEFLQGPIPGGCTVFVDIEISTPEGFAGATPAEVKAWAALAHDAEKAEFFHLLTQATIDRLREA